MKPGAMDHKVVPTADGSLTLAHAEHGETYHSHAGAASEARDLYVVASGIEGRWADRRTPVTVLDVGLGLGYNAVATIASWQLADDPPDLTVQSLEIDAALVAALASGTAPWQANWPDRELMIACSLQRRHPEQREGSLQFATTLHHPRAGAVCDWTVTIGDASTAPLPEPPPGGWQFVWQDPFSPEKNPPMWTPTWFAKVRAAAAPGCTLMTYSVARAVRDALTEAGWAVEKIPTTLKVKKHWLRAAPLTSPARPRC